MLETPPAPLRSAPDCLRWLAFAVRHGGVWGVEARFRGRWRISSILRDNEQIACALC
jgi:hypothetical protein